MAETFQLFSLTSSFKRVLVFSRKSLLKHDVSSLTRLWTSSVRSSSRISSAARVAARHALHCSRAVCKFGPTSTRIHHFFRHHIMRLLGAAFALASWFVASLLFTFALCERATLLAFGLHWLVFLLSLLSSRLHLSELLLFFHLGLLLHVRLDVHLLALLPQCPSG